MIRLRDYQQQCVDAVFEQFDSGKSTLVVMATGTGKTTVFGEVANRWLSKPRGRVLVLAHRDELIQQAAQRLHAMTGLDVGIEQAELRVNENAVWGKPPIVVASIQTLYKEKRHQRFDPKDFGLIICDEAHRSVASTWRKTLQAFGHPGLHIAGFTATPDRLDEEALGQVYESVAFTYDTVTAIDEGYLVPIKQQIVYVEGLDFSACNPGRDFSETDLERVINQDSVLHEIAKPTLEECGHRPTLVFTPSVQVAHDLMEVLNGYRPDCARAVDGKTDRQVRRQTLESFKRGEFQVLLNYGVYTEGTDLPMVSCVVMARPTKSRALYAQMAGRGLRPLPGLIDGYWHKDGRRHAIQTCVEKGNCLVLDFVGNAGKHKLVTSADILGGNYTDDEIERAKELLKEQPRDTQGALEQARNQLEEEEKEKARQQAESDKKSHRQWLKAKAVYTTREVDPFHVFDLHPSREPGWHKGRKPTEKQLAYLNKQGMPDTDKLTFHQATQLIDQCMKRVKDGQCSYKQMKILKKYGYEADTTFTNASKIIGALAANGWRPLPYKVQDSVVA